MNRKYSSYIFGLLAEYYVILILFFKGYILIKHRYKTKLGEIDLIFRKKKTIIAIEVKARSDLTTNIASCICEKQFHRIANSLKIFLNKNDRYSNFDIRIDAILIYKNLKFEYIKNIWNE